MGGKGTRFERAAIGVPVDAVAKSVAKGGGDRSKRGRQDVEQIEGAPLMRSVPPGVTSLVGQRFGQVEVVGLAVLTVAQQRRQQRRLKYVIGKSKGPIRWVVKCSCGRYGTMTTESLVYEEAYEEVICHHCRRERLRKDSVAEMEIPSALKAGSELACPYCGAVKAASYSGDGHWVCNECGGFFKEVQEKE